MTLQEFVVPGSTGGQSRLGGLIDHEETYGPHVIAQFVRRISSLARVVDLGAGLGRDLGIVKAIHPEVRTVAVEAGQDYANAIRDRFDEVYSLNIEKDRLPFDAESQDLIMANQVLEHTKEIFWIFHEVSRTLKVGGRFIFGTPNVCSLHNRLLMLMGTHPTQHKLVSAHVRPFSKRDTLKFLETCFPGGFELEAFKGSQFYPLPPKLARVASAAFPQAAFSIFFMIRKVKPYERGFLDHPVSAELETNFWLGPDDQSQYRDQTADNVVSR